MSRSEIMKKGHLARGSMESLGKAMGLGERLQSAISFGRASQAVVAQKGPARFAVQAENGTGSSEEDRAAGAESRRNETRNDVIELHDFSGSRLATAIAEMQMTIGRFERNPAAMPKQFGMRPDSETGRVAVDDPGAGNLIASRTESNKWDTAARIGSLAELARWPERGSDSYAQAARRLEIGSIGARAMAESSSLGADLSVRNRLADGEDRSISQEDRDADDRGRTGFDAAAVAAKSREFASPRLARAEFAEPSGHRSRGGAEGSSGISIHSAPTVIIHCGEARNEIEREVSSALRKHREELFDELQREAVRRERAEY